MKNLKRFLLGFGLLLWFGVSVLMTLPLAWLMPPVQTPLGQLVYTPLSGPWWQSQGYLTLGGHVLGQVTLKAQPWQLVALKLPVELQLKGYYQQVFLKAQLSFPQITLDKLQGSGDFSFLGLEQVSGRWQVQNLNLSYDWYNQAWLKADGYWTLLDLTLVGERLGKIILRPQQVGKNLNIILRSANPEAAWHLNAQVSLPASLSPIYLTGRLQARSEEAMPAWAYLLGSPQGRQLNFARQWSLPGLAKKR